MHTSSCKALVGSRPTGKADFFLSTFVSFPSDLRIHHHSFSYQPCAIGSETHGNYSEVFQ